MYLSFTKSHKEQKVSYTVSGQQQQKSTTYCYILLNETSELHLGAVCKTWIL